MRRLAARCKCAHTGRAHSRRQTVTPDAPFALDWAYARGLTRRGKPPRADGLAEARALAAAGRRHLLDVYPPDVGELDDVPPGHPRYLRWLCARHRLGPTNHGSLMSVVLHVPARSPARLAAGVHWVALPLRALRVLLPRDDVLRRCARELFMVGATIAPAAADRWFAVRFGR